MESEVEAITFRRAGPDDAAAFSALAESLFRKAFAATNDPLQMDAYCGSHYSEAIQRAELEQPHMAVYFVEVAGEVAGYIQMELTGDVAYLHRFYVDAAWHGRGIAQQMMEFCAGFARAGRARCIRLATWVNNRRAIAFYMKTGFEIVGEQPFLLGTEVQDDYVLERSIVAG